MQRGKVILLNGTSSSGKSSLARALQTLLSTDDAPYFHIEADLLRDTHPKRKLTKEVAMPNLLAALPESLAVWADHGCNLIIDDIFGGEQVTNYARVFAEYDALFVGVRCAAPVLDAREQARGDRKIGTARDMDRFCHAHGLYDIEVDTSECSPEQAAETVQKHLETGPPPYALRQLRDAALTDAH